MKYCTWCGINLQIYNDENGELAIICTPYIAHKLLILCIYYYSQIAYLRVYSNQPYILW